MNKSILITGATGFIGSFMTEEALTKGYATWAGVRENSSKQYLQHPQIQFIDLKYHNKEQLTLQLKQHIVNYGKIDYVIHCAGVTKTIKDCEFNKVNFQNTVNLIEALHDSNCNPEKFILMSSLSVMGDKGIDSSPFESSDIPNPNTLYGQSKLKAEQALINQNNIPYIILRPTGVYGPREKDYYLMLKSIRLGMNIKAGMQKQALTFIYIKDLVDATFSALESTVTNKTYFVTDGNVYTDNEYTNTVKRILEKKWTINIRIPLFLLKALSFSLEYFHKILKKTSTLNRDKYKIMKQRNWNCNTTPISNDLNFHPKYDLQQGLQESIEWFKAKGLL